MRQVVRSLVLVGIVAVGIPLAIAPSIAGLPVDEAVFASIFFLMYVCVGALIIVRRDGHPTGWLLVFIGLALVFANGSPSLWFVSPIFAAWLSSWGWALVFALFACLTLTFPTGRLPKGRGPWVKVARGAIFTLPFLVAVNPLTVTLGGSEMLTRTENPVGFLPAWMGIVSLIAIAVVLLGGVVSLIVKRRTAVGAERAQYGWVVFGSVLLVAAIVFTFLYVFASIAAGYGDPSDAVWTPAYVVMNLFPLTFGMAILRYRLYEIDRIVSRTVSYGVVVGLLAVVFFGAVTLLSSVASQASALTTAASTLLVFALFNPLRKRVHDWVDRRFNRSRYDIQGVIDRFAETLRHEVDQEGIVQGWVGVVAATMQPDAIGVWLGPRRDSR
jgi:hypothetical protein